MGYNIAVTAPPPQLRRARFAELSPFEVYGLCHLRVDGFVVEQQCPYPELDGRDVEPATVHLWFEEDGKVLATIRVLDDGETRTDELFGFEVPVEVTGVVSSLLDPRSTWADPDAYDAKARELADMFKANFAQFTADDNIVAAGPR